MSLQLADPADHASLGIFPDRAGVHYDDVRLFRAVHRHISSLGQGARHDLRVCDVHLAPIGLDKHPAGHRQDGIAMATPIDRAASALQLNEWLGHLDTLSVLRSFNGLSTN